MEMTTYSSLVLPNSASDRDDWPTFEAVSESPLWVDASFIPNIVFIVRPTIKCRHPVVLDDGTTDAIVQIIGEPSRVALYLMQKISLWRSSAR